MEIFTSNTNLVGTYNLMLIGTIRGYTNLNWV